jgi:hypothetical protein
VIYLALIMENDKKSQHFNSPKYKRDAQLQPQVQTQERHMSIYTL